jgi:hypothetical protein
LLQYHVMVHPYRVRNRESIKYSLTHGDTVLDFADTVEDFMNQFYAFKSYLIKIGFLAKDAHFAFNLSNINSQNFDKRPSKLGQVVANERSWNCLLDHFTHQEVLQVGLLCR